MLHANDITLVMMRPRKRTVTASQRGLSLERCDSSMLAQDDDFGDSEAWVSPDASCFCCWEAEDVGSSSDPGGLEAQSQYRPQCQSSLSCKR